MKKITILFLSILFVMCKSPARKLENSKSEAEKKLEKLKKDEIDNTTLTKENLVLPDYAQIRDDFRSVSENSRDLYLKGMSATDEKYSVVILTKGYKGENIQIKNDSKTFYSGMVMSDLKSGIAKSIRIDNTKDFTIYDNFTKRSLTIESNYASLFKFIYIMKNNSDKEIPFRITYSNTLRPVR